MFDLICLRFGLCLVCVLFAWILEKTIRTKLVPELNAKVQFLVKETLDSNKKGFYSITTDIWSSPSRDSFMTLTLHLITEDFDRKVVILRCIRYNMSHTASNLGNTLKGIWNDWGIQDIHVILRDNASNIVQGVTLAGYESMGCFLSYFALSGEAFCDGAKWSEDDDKQVRIFLSTLSHACLFKKNYINIYR